VAVDITKICGHVVNKLVAGGEGGGSCWGEIFAFGVDICERTHFFVQDPRSPQGCFICSI